MNNQKIQLVADYVFEEFGNVELAISVIQARAEIQNRIIDPFLKELKNELASKLSNNKWLVIKHQYGEIFDKYDMIYITKEQWKDLYRIALCPENYDLRNFQIGVWNNIDELKNPIDKGEIKRTIENKFRSGFSAHHWPFWFWADYRNWNIDHDLLKIYKQPQKVSKYFSDNLCLIAEAVESTIDGIVGNLNDNI